MPGIQLDRAVIGIHDGLDTVADVVDLGATLGDPVAGRGVGGSIAQIDLGGVRVVRGGRVPVDDPHHASIDDSGQGVAVHGEPRGNLGDPVTGLAVVEDLGVRVHPVREQQVDVGHLGGVHGTQHRIADGHPTVSGIGGHGLGPGSCRTTTGGVELNGFCPVPSTDDHPGIRHLAVVDARLVLLDGSGGGDVLGQPGGFPGVLPASTGSGDHAVAVGVDGVDVVPALVGDAVLVDLAGSHDDIGGLAVDRVTVHVKDLGEGVETAYLLQLLESGSDNGGVHESDGRQRLGVGLELTGRRRGACSVVGDRRVLDAERLAGGSNVVDDVGPFLVRGVRDDLEPLHDRRIDPLDDEGGDEHERNTHPRYPPTSPPGVGDEQRCDEEGDDGNDDLGSGSVVVGSESDAGEQTVVGDGEPVTSQDRRQPEEHQTDGQQHRDVRLRTC